MKVEIKNIESAISWLKHSIKKDAKGTDIDALNIIIEYYNKNNKDEI
tara:strand:+ start:169 stop:309 length:141 start_codon:yes stop_codon:yes gene_type:complete